MKKNYNKYNKSKNRKQINYINNRHNLVNIEQLNAEAREAFWFGLVTGLFTAFWLMSDKSEKKEVKC